MKSIVNIWITVLVVYFCILIAGSLIYAVIIWKPTSQSFGTNTTKVTETPLSLANKSPPSSSTATPAATTTKTIVNNASGMTIKNNTTSYITGKNVKKEITNTSFIPSSLEKETRLIELSLLFGIIGSSVHGVTSLTMWHSRNKLERSFFSWYVTKPLIGAALAATVYLLLRSTLLTTVANGSQLGGITFINDYGIAGISALVGLMTAQMTQKLRDVFDAMFGIQKGTDKGEIDVVENNITLIPKELQISVDQSSVLVAVVKDNGNKPISNVDVEFGIVDSNVVKSLDRTLNKTDANGMVTLQIRGNKEGNTKVHAAIEMENKTIYYSSTVKVIGSQQVTAEGKVEVAATKKSPPSIVFPVDQKTQVKAGSNIELKVKVVNSDDSPEAKTKVHFTIDNTDYAEFMDTSNKLSVDTEVDSLGFAAVKVKGINPGKAVVTATGKIEGDSEGMNNSLTIEIIN